MVLHSGTKLLVSLVSLCNLMDEVGCELSQTLKRVKMSPIGIERKSTNKIKN